MKREYIITIESYIWNNSDFKEYDNYSVSAKNIENATRYAKMVVSHWNKQDTSIIYNIFNIREKGR